MKWSQKFETGVPEVDSQHRQLFEWLEQIETAAADQRMMMATYALTRLIQYTRDHFAAEENLMTDCGYPGLDAHREEHDMFRQRLRGLQIESVSRDISGEAIAWLNNWLSTHILAADMDYVPFVRSAKAAEKNQ